MNGDDGATMLTMLQHGQIHGHDFRPFFRVLRKKMRVTMLTMPIIPICAHAHMEILLKSHGQVGINGKIISEIRQISDHENDHVLTMLTMLEVV